MAGNGLGLCVGRASRYKSSIHIRPPCLRKTPVIGSAFLGLNFPPILNGKKKINK